MTQPAVTEGAATLAAVLAVLLLVSGRPRSGRQSPTPGSASGLLLRGRGLWAALAGLAGLTWVRGWPGLVLATALAAGVWWGVGRTEPASARRARESARAQLPHVVMLFAAALRAGAAPGPALAAVCRALPGAAADRLAPTTARLALGGDPADVWADLASDPELAPLGRCLARAHRTGASVVDAVTRLARELAAERRAAVLDRARAVGVQAAVPLGLCLLPAFLLLGIVPVVAGLAGVLLGP